MGDTSQKIDVNQLLSFCDDLIGVLRDKRDINILSPCVHHSNTLHSSCQSDFNSTQLAISDYQKNTDECKLKIKAANSEIVGDEDIDGLQKELDEELKREQLLRDNLRGLVDEINELDDQRLSIEKSRQVSKKLLDEEDKEQKKLSFYASATNLVPDLKTQSIISGHIVQRDKKVVKKFEFDPTREDAFDICNKTWKMIDP